MKISLIVVSCYGGALVVTYKVVVCVLVLQWWSDDGALLIEVVKQRTFLSTTNQGDIR